MEQELKYYKGEKSNPFEEVTEEQGLHCQRYNEVASMLWFFEYHWANGWERYKKLEGFNPSYYFELHEHPQKEFESIEDALLAFSRMPYCGVLRGGCKRWVLYIYEHARLERFYKPVFNIVPKEELPAYLTYYHGECLNPHAANGNAVGEAKSFWWEFERNWYKSSEVLSKEAYEQHLHSYLMRASEHHPKSKEYLQELKAQLERFKSWSSQ